MDYLHDGCVVGSVVVYQLAQRPTLRWVNPVYLQIPRVLRLSVHLLAAKI